MTDEELKAIEARAAAATVGPWTVGHVEKWHVFGDPAGDVMARGLGRVVLRANEHFAYDDDMAFVASARTDVPALVAEVRRLRAELNTPETQDFIEGVKREAAHQRERWGSNHDAGKTDADWFWLIGYLAGKALHKSEKRLHHLITCAAALLNWHLQSLGMTNMRPGIQPPDGPQPAHNGGNHAP